MSRWGRLDASAPFDEYASGGAAQDVVARVEAFAPDVVLAVDWSALPLYRGLRRKLLELPKPLAVPLVYLNYRVFTRTSSGDELQLVKK